MPPASAPRAAPYDDPVRWIWLIVAVLVCAAAWAAVWPRGGGAPDRRATEDEGAHPVERGSPIHPGAEGAGASTPASHGEPADGLQPGPGRPPAGGPPSARETARPPATALSQLLPSADDAGAIALAPGPAAVVERLDAETVRLDGRFTVRGSGVERDPYRITWDLLTSAAETISAEEKRWVLPGRLAALDGSWVQISGYWAPPLQQFQTREIMVMLNRWDGCCIGRPPTAYDCMDVRLAAPMAVTGQHLFRYGTVRGRLRIAPFAAGPYLLGLYELQDATLESS